MVRYYQTNVLFVEKINYFFERNGFQPRYEFTDEPPASDAGKLVRIILENFDPNKLDKKSKQEWSSLPLEVVEK